MSDMNNFFMNQDPLMTQPPIISQMNPVVYQQMQQMSVKDNIGELDKILKELSPAVMARLSENTRFGQLSNDFQSNVQQELLSLVRGKLNASQTVTDNVKEQMKIIEEVKKDVESEKEKSLNELNDYMKNYSHLTFDDYKKMKNGEPLDKKKRCL